MSLRQGQHSKKNIPPEQYNQERGFETYLHGANQQRVQVKRQNEKSSDQRNVSKERKKWQEQQVQQQQIIQQKNQDSQQKVESAQRSKWNKLPPGKDDIANNNKKIGQKQNISQIEGESIVNYIQTMDKDELEMLRQSLIGQNLQKMMMKKGLNNNNISPNKEIAIEEDDDIKNMQYDEDYENDGEQNNHNEDNEDDEYNDEGFDNIEEEIQDNMDNQSDLYNYQHIQNDRSYQGFNSKKYQLGQQQQIQGGKMRPISAIESNKYNQQNLYSNNMKNYESSHNIGKFDNTYAGQSYQDEDQQKDFVYNEETKQLNTNPFNLKKNHNKNDNNKEISNKNVINNNAAKLQKNEDISSIYQKPNNVLKKEYHKNEKVQQQGNEKQKQQQQQDQGNSVESRDKGLEELFLKLSRMNEGVRSELATLIDKIGNGELDISAIKSLLFMQNNNSNQSLNINESSKSEQIKESQHSRIHSEPIQQNSIQKNKNQQNQIGLENNYYGNVNIRRDIFGEEEAKPETIKFSRDQFSVSLSKGLLKNTQELEKTLNFGGNQSDEEDNHGKNDRNLKKNLKDIDQNSYQIKDNKNDQYDIMKDKINEVQHKEIIEQNDIKNDNYDDEEDMYFEEEVVEEEDEPINQKFYNKLNQNKLKDTLQRKKEADSQQFKFEVKKPTQINDEISSEKPNKKSDAKTTIPTGQESNKTFNLAKKEKQNAGGGLKDIKEQKGEVFIIIRVISTWGSAHLVGLTEIKVYDEEGTNIKLKMDDFMIEGGAQTSLRNIHRICNGVYDTIDSEQMWQGTMPDPPKCMEIGIRFKSAKGIGAIKIWNYNKSLIDSVKGIKEIEILRKNQLIWSGQVKKGLGKEHENYCDIIKFKEDIILEDDKPKASVRNSLQSGIIPPKVNQSKEIPKGNLKQDDKAIPQIDTSNKLMSKKSVGNLDDNETNKSSRQRGVNLPSSTNATPTSRIRSAQQKAGQLQKENDEIDTQTTSSTSNLKKNIEVKLDKEFEIDSLSNAISTKNSLSKVASQTTRSRNNDSDKNVFVGQSGFDNRRSSQKQDDSKNQTFSSSNLEKQSQKNLHLTQNQLPSSDQLPDYNPSKSTKKGPKVLNVYDDKISQKGLGFPPHSESQKVIPLSESPAQRKRQTGDFKEDKVPQNFKDRNQQINKNYAFDDQKSEQDIKKKSSDESSNGKGDDFMEHVKFFNATHQGRFQPAERERILQNQANEAQEAVKQTLQNLNPLFGMSKVKKYEDQEIKSDEDSNDYNSKLDIFMKESIQLQSHFSSSITKSNSKLTQSKSSKPIKTVLEDDDSILDKILREDENIQTDIQAQKNKNQTLQQDIFAPKKTQPLKDIPKENIKQEIFQTAQKKTDISANLDDTNIFQNELNKLLESKNEPFLGDILKSVQKDFPSTQKEQINQIEKQKQQQQQQFAIPLLPEGRHMRIEIYSTWGDSHYVGLSGIEFFDSRGNPITINNAKKQIKADPSDINILPEYGEDPRTCDKLVDGHYLTCDDLHMWLAPFQEGKVNYIYVDFLTVQKLSMIRIWNYNKSRIHSFRGAKDISIYFDENPIFAGPISRAQGIQYYAPKDCEYIMLTDKETILQQIEKNDWLNTYQFSEIEEEQNAIDKLLQTQQLQRPQTRNNHTESSTSLSSQPRSLTGKDGRPITSAKPSSSYQLKEEELDKKLNSKANQVIEYQMQKSQNKSLKRGVKCSTIKINILKSWEDKFYVGLTGIEIYDEYGQKIQLKESQIKARPKDLNDISGVKGDQRTLDKLIDGVNLTTNEKHMWLVQLLEQPQNYLQINFNEERIISGIKIWNYNKPINYYDSKSVDSNRGAKIISITADDNILLTPQQGIMLRKAPGRDLFDYGQMIAFPFENGWNQETIQSLQLPTQVNSVIIQEYDTIYLPRGFNFRFNIHSTWGDSHYCGLNGIELYDSFGNEIIEKKLAEFKLGAEPASVNILPGCQGDIRTIDKLVNCQNNTFDDRNMWLAPFINSHSDKNVICPHLKMNTIYMCFEKPVIISAIAFWNYSKTPSRGVREIEIFLDDKLIFRGYLKKAPTQQQYNNDAVPLYNTVIFNRNQEILKKIKPVVYNEDKLHQNVIFHNEGKVDETNKNQGTQQQLQVAKVNNGLNALERPTTKVSGMKI